MDDLIWRLPRHGATLDVAAQRTVDAVAHRRQGGLFPPVAAPVGPVVSESRRLSGPHDARLLAAALSRPRFAPLTAALADIDTWCAHNTGRHGATVAPDVLSLDNDGLFGPVVTELFTVCAADKLPDVAGHCRRRTADWLSFLDEFLDRSHTGLPGLARGFGVTAPIVALSAHDGETHNGGRRVLRLTDANGTTLAYKARPATGETLFLTTDSGGSTPDSIFALLNRLTGDADLALPTLRCIQRETDADAWLWQEWVDPAPARELHREHGLTVSGPVVASADAPLLWRRAGALTAAAMAFGLTDLMEGNLLAGRCGGEAESRHHIVDLELFAQPVSHLSQTGLVAEPGPRHHVGFEDRPRLCAADTPMAYLRPSGDGLELVRSRTPWARRTTDTVIGDGDGRFGYGHWLPHVVRGAFDLWATLCRHRDEIAGFARDRRDTVRTRVLPRDTEEYCRILRDRLLTGEPVSDRLHASEREQLVAGDVPYFHTGLDDEHLSTAAGPGTGPAVTDDLLDVAWPRDADWKLAELGMTLRGLLDHAGDPAPRRADGIRTGAYEVAVDWPEFDSRLVYAWDDDTHRVTVGDLTEPEPLTEVAKRLLRIDHADAVLRTEWVASGREDTESARRLADLAAEATAWLETVVDEHGWPTAELVGDAAAAAAVRLLQHVDGALEFRRRCLRELEAAAGDGRAAMPDVAFVTDALCLAEGLPQRYGTKFERVNGELVPCRLADPDCIDTDRAAMGLPSLDAYARRVRDHFDPPASAHRPRDWSRP